MARGRVISPDFWTDSNIIPLSPFARLFYIGTWNFAYCDQGHLPDDAMGLKLKILPADPVDADELLKEVMGRGRIVRIVVDGKTFLQVPTLVNWQSSTTDNRYKSRCPVCKLLETPQTSAGVSRDLGNSANNSVKGRGGELRGVEVKGEAPPRKCPEHIHVRFAPKCGACKEARLEHEQWVKDHPPATKSGIVTPTNICPKHEYPLPCPRCADEVA